MRTRQSSRADSRPATSSLRAAGLCCLKCSAIVDHCEKKRDDVEVGRCRRESAGAGCARLAADGRCRPGGRSARGLVQAGKQRRPSCCHLKPAAAPPPGPGGTHHRDGRALSHVCQLYSRAVRQRTSAAGRARTLPLNTASGELEAGVAFACSRAFKLRGAGLEFRKKCEGGAFRAEIGGSRVVGSRPAGVRLARV